MYRRQSPRTAFPTPPQLGQIGGGGSPAKNPRPFWPLLATPGRGQTIAGAAAMAVPSSIGTGTPAPATRLPLDPAPTHPREPPFSHARTLARKAVDAGGGGAGRLRTAARAACAPASEGRLRDVGRLGRRSHAGPRGKDELPRRSLVRRRQGAATMDDLGIAMEHLDRIKALGLGAPGEVVVVANMHAARAWPDDGGVAEPGRGEVSASSRVRKTCVRPTCTKLPSHAPVKTSSRCRRPRDRDAASCVSPPPGRGEAHGLLQHDKLRPRRAFAYRVLCKARR